MDTPGPLASATALARTPLFAHLGRVDLARLAGELEEQRFKAGDAIVHEGEPADAFYVVKSGEASVMLGTQSLGADGDLRIRPGECFGEMALLADSPRTASVLALTDVTVWRLSRARFGALVARERTIARGIELALVHRLLVTSRELAAVRTTAHALAHAALEGLSAEAVALLRGFLARPSWPAEALARICARTGHVEAAAELERVPGLIARTDSHVRVDETAAGLVSGALGEPDGRWLAAAAAELYLADDLVGALDLALRAGDFATAGRILADDAERLVERASPGDLGRLLDTGRPVPRDLSVVLAGLQSRVAARRPGRDHRRTRRPRPHSWPQRLRVLVHVVGPLRIMAAVVAILVFALGWRLPPPPGLDRAAVVTLAGLVGMIPLLACPVLPDSVIVLLLATVLVGPGLVAPADMLAGFATPAWLMILALLVVGSAVSRSGLMFRVVLMSLERLPANFLTQSLVLAGTGLFMTAGLSAGATRVALGVPIARGIAEALGFARRSAGAAAIGLVMYFAFVQAETLFLTGSFTALVVHDLLPAAARGQITWWRWFVVALPPLLLTFVLYYLFLLAHLRPQGARRVDVGAVRVQEELLGRLTREEIWSVVILGLLVVGFATRPYHGLAPAWMAVGVLVLLFVVGVLDQAALQSGVNIGLLVYSGVILSLGEVFKTLGIDAWLASLVRVGMPSMAANPYGFVAVLALVAFALRFVVPWMTLATLLALVTMPLAEGLGIHPFVPLLVTLIASDHTFLPYVNVVYSLLYFASDGELFSHAQARWPLMVEALIRLVALVASVPAWRFAGLL
jgi:CRP-like cAMP-binding protein